MRKRLIPLVAISFGLICVAGTAQYRGWLRVSRKLPDQPAPEVDLPIMGGTGLNTGGSRSNKPLRETSSNVVLLEPGVLDSPDLPPGGKYRLFTFDSSNETDFTFTAANTTGYGLFTASAPKLVEDDNFKRSLDPTTTLVAVWPKGSASAGVYIGTNKYLVARDEEGRVYFPSGSARSAAPTRLLAISDGRSATLPPAAIQDGSDVLWLTFETPTGTISFVVVAQKP